MRVSCIAESQNAVVEQATQEVQSTARTLVHACQEHHRVKLPLTHTVRICAIEYARSTASEQIPESSQTQQENHLDDHCHHSEKSCTSRSQQREKDESAKIDGTVESDIAAVE